MQAHTDNFLKFKAQQLLPILLELGNLYLWVVFLIRLVLFHGWVNTTLHLVVGLFLLHVVSRLRPVVDNRLLCLAFLALLWA